jgi:parallel beta-helix repeat protein
MERKNSVQAPQMWRLAVCVCVCLGFGFAAVGCDSEETDNGNTTTADTSGTSDTSDTTQPTDTTSDTTVTNCGSADGVVLPCSDAPDTTDEDTTPWVPDPACDVVLPPESTQENILAAFIEAEENDLICFAPGTYNLDRELSLTVNNVTVQGAGMDATTIDFAGQAATGVGANGIYVRADGFTIQDITVKNTPGDSIRVEGTSNAFVQRATYTRVRVTWDAGPNAENGSYALYPVFVDNVLIEECEVSYASDAGVYVGQSRNIIVRNNDVFGNVAGIEIENSFDADVYGNNAHGNTCGILVFDLPDKPQQGGKRTRVFDNIMDANNEPNFAPPGNIVGQVPAGIGMMLLSNDENEIFNNTITGNQSTGLVLVSYLSLDQGYKPDCGDNLDNDEDTFKDFPEDPDCESAADDSEEPGKQHYDPYPERNYIHDNILRDNGQTPDPRSSLITLIKLLLQADTLESLFWDGFVDATKTDPTRNCWRNNTDGLGYPASWRNLDAPGGAANTSTTPGEFDCEGTVLPAVDLGR